MRIAPRLGCLTLSRHDAYLGGSIQGGEQQRAGWSTSIRLIQLIAGQPRSRLSCGPPPPASHDRATRGPPTNSETRGPRLDSSILEKLAGHSAALVATSQLAVNRLGLDEHTVGAFLEHDLRTRAQALTIAQALWNDDLAVGSNPMSHTEPILVDASAPTVRRNQSPALPIGASLGRPRGPRVTSRRA